MDMLKLSSKFMRGIVAKLLTKAIRNKIGCDIEVVINELEITMDGEKARLHASLDANINKNDVTKIVKNIGLE